MRLPQARQPGQVRVGMGLVGPVGGTGWGLRGWGGGVGGMSKALRARLGARLTAAMARRPASGGGGGGGGGGGVSLDGGGSTEERHGRWRRVSEG